MISALFIKAEVEDLDLKDLCWQEPLAWSTEFNNHWLIQFTADFFSLKKAIILANIFYTWAFS